MLCCKLGNFWCLNSDSQHFDKMAGTVNRHLLKINLIKTLLNFGLAISPSFPSSIYCQVMFCDQSIKLPTKMNGFTNLVM